MSRQNSYATTSISNPAREKSPHLVSLTSKLPNFVEPIVCKVEPGPWPWPMRWSVRGTRPGCDRRVFGVRPKSIECDGALQAEIFQGLISLQRRFPSDIRCAALAGICGGWRWRIGPRSSCTRLRRSQLALPLSLENRDSTSSSSRNALQWPCARARWCNAASWRARGGDRLVVRGGRPRCCGMIAVVMGNRSAGRGWGFGQSSAI